MNIAEEIRRRAALQPERPALIQFAADGSETVTSYRALLDDADARAATLRKTGVRAGDRCGLIAPQGPDFVSAALGILATGACLVPIPEGGGSVEVDPAVTDTQLHYLWRETEPAGITKPPVARAAGAGFDEGEFRALEPAYLRFTSGTTNARKGVLLGHASILERTRLANAGLAITNEDRILWTLPLAHHFVVSILLYLRYGAAVLFPASHRAQHVLEAGSRGGATVLYASPYHYTGLAKDRGELALPALRLAISTADGLRAETARAFEARFGCALTQALGVIEVGLPVMNLASAKTKPEALGRPLPGYDVWLRADSGERVADSSPERTGELCIRGSGLLDAYLSPWSSAAQILEPDGFRTGDQGYFDSDGDLHLVGRRSNRISMAGMKFFAEEVEAVLTSHDGVSACRVRAEEHPHLGSIPVAEVVAVGSQEHKTLRRELTELCRSALPSYKVPRKIAIVEALPETPTGKLRRW
jgi:long-chain acyl-CoA synthetase